MADEEKLRQYLKKATGELQRTARKLQEAELRDSEPIAIVGMSCRFPPDLRSAEDLWRFVSGEGDGISAFPEDRGWGTVSVPGGAGATPEPSARQGGFVAGADRFDAEFFGIGENEALAMDPQQRLLLETAWEAVEHAGLDPAGLRGTLTGVYAGLSYCHYAGGPQAALPAGVEDQLIVGGAPSTASGRVSYVLGLRGPAISIDTACSSSLVAMHLACQGLRRGDCELALAGGVTIMATPDVIVEFGRRGALAADGRCKPFASAADGMGFGEGAGLLVLERLSEARRNGRSVLAVIRGSAVNQDGATNGMTSPSRAAQEAVIRQALASAGLTPDQVDAVEGHGTGTPLGDSIEAEALIATYGENRPAGRPLRLGSVKSNIGHTQTASGVASVIKTVMSMRAGTHPRTLHIDRPSGYVDWSDGTVELTTESVPWPADGRPRRAGVSSFGISGTNAHLILEEPAAADGASAPAPGGTDAVRTPWVLSARTEPALRAMAAELAGLLAAEPASAAAVGRSLARTRAGFGHRAVSVAASVDEHLAALAALARGEDAPGLTTGAGTAAKTAVVFTGREPGAGDPARTAAARFPAFAEAYDEVRARLEARLGRPLSAYRYAAVFALQVALYRLIRSCGVVPELVAGSGIGEITAAHAAGVLTLDDAVALAADAARAADAGDREAGHREAGDRLRATAERIGCAEPRITLVSPGEPGRPEYWAAGGFLRSGTEDVLSGVRSRGATACLELDPGAVLAEDGVLTRLATAYTAGTTVSWEALFTGTDAGRVRLPGYPFQRKRYWLDAPAGPGRGGNEVVRQPVHPLLGGPIDLADATERRFTRTLTAREPWYVAQYRLRGTPALPPAAVAEWALAAARHAAPDGGAGTIENLAFGEPATVPGTPPLTLQAAAETHGAVRRIRGFSADPEDSGRGWTLRFTASATGETPSAPSPADLGRLRSRMTEQDPEALFARLGAAGIACGPDFRRITRGWWLSGDEALAVLETDAVAADGDRHVLHPVVLEACFLTALPLVAGDGDGDGDVLWLPSGLTRLTCHRELPRRLWCHVRRTPAGPVDLELYSDTGEPLVTVAGLTHAPSGLVERAAADAEPDLAEPWDADELSRLAVEQPSAARQALTEILFARVTALVEGLADDRENLRARFADTRLGDLGLDSLRAMRLREQFRTGLLVDVPPQRLLGDTTVADIADLVCRSLAARSLVMTVDEEPEAAGPIEELIL
ncbi:type I polyketide synthase [Streptomyces echinatus]|uniref:Acyl transferase domain-containing protein n=1 Tax=Streptomyces echinatus TaxID=67293 RepID=A0A7W9UR81_9ACTN|nr:beta-ketoacyl synthase N-terminal-like domain-containing protein [Streptomyces echinatus]MBB5928203.1 acyl transferase domain-containing protein [Streptomyces echinatus]